MKRCRLLDSEALELQRPKHKYHLLERGNNERKTNFDKDDQKIQEDLLFGPIQQRPETKTEAVQRADKGFRRPFGETEARE